MSVTVIEPKVFELVLNRMLYYGSQTEKSISYCEELSKNYRKRTIEEYETYCHTLVRLWYSLYDKSYHYKYRENETYFADTIVDIRLDRKITPINTYQFVKYLHCIKYNIEISTIGIDNISLSESGAHSELEQIIKSITFTIITELPQYKEAEWSDPVK